MQYVAFNTCLFYIIANNKSLSCFVKIQAARQQQKSKAIIASEKLREKLLKILLKQKAISQVLDEIRAEQPTTRKPDMFELPPSAASEAENSE